MANVEQWERAKIFGQGLGQFDLNFEYVENFQYVENGLGWVFSDFGSNHSGGQDLEQPCVE